MRRVAVLARRAVTGRVKTRLSPALPAALACELHAAMTSDTLATIAAVSADERFVLWDAPASNDATSIDVPAGIGEGTQGDGDLGARLAAAFEELLRGADAVVIVGTDCPDLRARHLEDAFAALARHDLVLGPRRDGGYWLVGLTRRAPELFADIPWGTDTVFARTVERAADAGLPTSRLEMLSDIDTPEDLVRLIGRWLVDPAARTAKTARALERIGLLPGGKDDATREAPASPAPPARPR